MQGRDAGEIGGLAHGDGAGGFGRVGIRPVIGACRGDLAPGKVRLGAFLLLVGGVEVLLLLGVKSVVIGHVVLD
jgi:hypothetical protein